MHNKLTVQCSVLNNANNGIIKCVLGDDQAPSYEDTYNFTCNTGYELIGSDTTSYVPVRVMENGMMPILSAEEVCNVTYV